MTPPLPQPQEPTTGDLTYLSELTATDAEVAVRLGRSERFVSAQYERAQQIRRSGPPRSASPVWSGRPRPAW